MSCAFISFVLWMFALGWAWLYAGVSAAIVLLLLLGVLRLRRRAPLASELERARRRGVPLVVRVVAKPKREGLETPPHADVYTFARLPLERCADADLLFQSAETGVFDKVDEEWKAVCPVVALAPVAALKDDDVVWYDLGDRRERHGELLWQMLHRLREFPEVGKRPDGERRNQLADALRTGSAVDAICERAQVMGHSHVLLVPRKKWDEFKDESPGMVQAIFDCYRPPRHRSDLSKVALAASLAASGVLVVLSVVTHVGPRQPGPATACGVTGDAPAVFLRWAREGWAAKNATATDKWANDAAAQFASRLGAASACDAGDWMTSPPAFSGVKIDGCSLDNDRVDRAQRALSSRLTELKPRWLARVRTAAKAQAAQIKDALGDAAVREQTCAARGRYVSRDLPAGSEAQCRASAYQEALVAAYAETPTNAQVLDKLKDMGALKSGVRMTLMDSWQTSKAPPGANIGPECPDLCNDAWNAYLESITRKGIVADKAPEELARAIDEWSPTLGEALGSGTCGRPDTDWHRQFDDLTTLLRKDGATAAEVDELRKTFVRKLTDQEKLVGRRTRLLGLTKTPFERASRSLVQEADRRARKHTQQVGNAKWSALIGDWNTLFYQHYTQLDPRFPFADGATDEIRPDELNRLIEGMAAFDAKHPGACRAECLTECREPLMAIKSAYFEAPEITLTVEVGPHLEVKLREKDPFKVEGNTVALTDWRELESVAISFPGHERLLFEGPWSLLKLAASGDFEVIVDGQGVVRLYRWPDEEAASIPSPSPDAPVEVPDPPRDETPAEPRAEVKPTWVMRIFRSGVHSFGTTPRRPNCYVHLEPPRR